ncbi:MAG: hypothetical protein U5L07_07740 [Desulfobacterales bacterium]|nr:hypothetical protein [Desulfobacterales bacterium]
MPNHGKQGNVFRHNHNGFAGAGLDDLTWGVFSSASDSAYFEVAIDSEEGGTGSVDTFKWRENGGAWTENVDITGSAQTLSGVNGDQIVTFAATTGHTLNDQWARGNLYDEACTVTDDQAQITDATRRMLDPENPPTFTDSGGANVLSIDYARGIAYFDAACGTVTVTGEGSHVPAAALEKCGYMYDWKLDGSVDLAEISAFQDDWKTHKPGLAEFSGGAEGYFASSKWFAAIENAIDGTRVHFLLQLFSYDPDNDQTGDHFICWATFTSFNTSANKDAIVGESINFQGQGAPAFVPNA